jgi:alpha-beta hydrolase superfamily lysophospholipase
METTVSNIPVIWLEPTATPARKLVIWLHGFTESHADVTSNLRDLAAAGYVAFSFDPADHGTLSRYPQEREIIDPTDGSFIADTDGKLYRHFWSIEAETADSIPRLIDWAIAELGVVPEVGIGGKSMGGDIAVAAAGLDKRITVVAACIATPDWLKPGSIYEVRAPNAAIQAQFDQHNPITNLERYQHCPAMLFQCGTADTVVPAAGALRFSQALADTYRNCPYKLEVLLEEGVEHELTETMWRNALRWFARFL